MWFLQSVFEIDITQEDLVYLTLFDKVETPCKDALHTAILKQLQHHFDLPPAAEPSTSTTAVPHSHPIEPQAPSGAPTKEADPSA
ncbi:hypothetical protein CK203_053147 [Vitis vinifera]|uniref:Uncharacterized protein n=1 Tax=Vitis vinifera TaxID=29760 RepID=A0A438GP44_VITVI|nr:hypothetical protein CK203_053147 [Vitis vinifera]